MRPKDIGTRAETAVVNALHRMGHPDAARVALAGSADRGDIHIPRLQVCIEVKAGAQTRSVSDRQRLDWLQDAHAEAARCGPDWWPVLVLQRHGVGPTNADRWWAWQQLHGVPFATLLADAPHWWTR